MKKIEGEATEEIKALERIYFSFFKQLVHYASNFIPEAFAADLVQEIFFKVWMNKRAVLTQFDEHEIRTYLYHAVLNACRDYAKHKKVEETYLARTLHAIRLDELDFHETKLLLGKKDKQLEEILSEIDKLPGRCREIFRRRYLQQESCARIAEEMSISVRTVEAQLYKALKLIRQALYLILVSWSSWTN